jgi:hypothetical protein
VQHLFASEQVDARRIVTLDQGPHLQSQELIGLVASETLGNFNVLPIKLRGGAICSPTDYCLLDADDPIGDEEAGAGDHY